MFLHLSASHSVHRGEVYTAWADTPQADPPDGYCNRQYTYYWKAFLFKNENDWKQYPTNPTDSVDSRIQLGKTRLHYFVWVHLKGKSQSWLFDLLDKSGKIY